MGRKERAPGQQRMERWSPRGPAGDTSAGMSSSSMNSFLSWETEPIQSNLSWTAQFSPVSNWAEDKQAQSSSVTSQHTQQNMAVQSHTAGQVSPTEGHRQRHFHSLVWEVSAAASAHPPVTLGQLQAVDKGQALPPRPLEPSLPNNKKHSNIRTASPKKRKAPVFSLCPRQTDYILYKLTIIQKQPQCYPTSENEWM